MLAERKSYLHTYPALQQQSIEGVAMHLARPTAGKNCAMMSALRQPVSSLQSKPV